MSAEIISANEPVAIVRLPAGRRRWAATAIFTALAMASLDTAIANIALPAIAADLHASPADVIWVVNVYQISIVATLLPFAALGEVVGHTGFISAAFCCSRWPRLPVHAPGHCPAC
jgi:MFS transporter, DHA2 family, multidrug resistance protein